jgi:hypothetical protein
VAADEAVLNIVHKKTKSPLKKQKTENSAHASSWDTDKGSESQCLFDPWIRDPVWVKSKDPGSGMNNPDRISQSLETILLVNILN